MAQKPPNQQTFGEQQFSFPTGYTLDRVAGPPMVDRPIEACFDDQGHLFVTESSGSNDPAEKQRADKPHRVLRLTDRDGDGVYDERTVFADGLMFPEGCLWKDGVLYVAAVPEILKFTDADGDGVAEKREVWFDGKTMTGCVNDLHGPYAGPDGWIYWCKGAFAEQTYDLPDQQGWTTRASHVFRARHNGSGIEPVFTAGMDNPVGLAWTPEGEMIVAGTFFQEPAGGQRDGLIHAVYGGVWGKDHDVLQGHPRTGALMPPMTQLGPAAPCGIARYGRDLLVCQFNLRQVSRHVLQPMGATYRTEDEPFLVCDHPDFHPTDVLQDRDGSVLVIDTGGWYKLCCPTSQIAKPQALGAIYRLRKTGGEVPPSCPPPQWTIGDIANVDLQIQHLSDSDLHVRRRAAEALGRAHAKAAVPALLEALAAADMDRFLFHAYTYALLQIGDVEATRVALQQGHPVVVAAAVYALEQMPDGKLTAPEVIEKIDTDDESLREAAMFAVQRHLDWNTEIQAWLERIEPDPKNEILSTILKHFAQETWVQDWLLRALLSHPTRSVTILNWMTDLALPNLPEPWINPLIELLTQSDDPIRLAGLRLLNRCRPAQLNLRLEIQLHLLAMERTDNSMRYLALAATNTPDIYDQREFCLILSAISSKAPELPAMIANKKPSVSYLRGLAYDFHKVGIIERPAFLQLFIGCDDEEVATLLLKSFKSTQSLASLPQELLAEATAKFPESLRQQLLTLASPPPQAGQVARLNALEKSLPPGDLARGVILFQSPKASCSICHPVGYKGGHVGPDLSKVGAVRTRRDLLEAIAYPSASFVRSYEPMEVKQKNGTTTYGILSNQSADTLTVTTGAIVPPITIPRREIEKLTPGTISLMPQGLDRILSEQELADIITYLQSLK